MHPIDMEADRVVGEMAALGAKFELEPTADGEAFVWFARPASQRDVVAAFWEAVDKAPGLRAAMVRAIRRRQAGGAL